MELNDQVIGEIEKFKSYFKDETIDEYLDFDDEQDSQLNIYHLLTVYHTPKDCGVVLVDGEIEDFHFEEILDVFICKPE